MSLIINLLIFVLVLGLIVSLHELGHFLVAKRSGVHVHEFSLGFGPKLYQRKGKKTKYTIRLIPLGGYVSMATTSFVETNLAEGVSVGLNLHSKLIKEIVLNEGLASFVIVKVVSYFEENDLMYLKVLQDGREEVYQIANDAVFKYSDKKSVEVVSNKKTFEHAKKWKRLLILLAGPAMNFVLAFFLFFVMLLAQGRPMTNITTIGKVSEMSPLVDYDIMPGDEIISVGGVLVNTYQEILQQMEKAYSGQDIALEYKRGEENLQVTLTPGVRIDALGIMNYDLITKQFTNEMMIALTNNRNEGVLKNGDIIVSYRNKTENVPIPANNWKELGLFVKNLVGENTVELVLRIKRGISEEEVVVELWNESVLKLQSMEAYQFYLGVTPTYRFSFGYSFTNSFRLVGESSMEIFTTIKMLVVGNSQVGVGDLAGPVGIFDVIGRVRASGFLQLMYFVGALSINIGIVNLLPIPAFDGGRILFLGYEAVFRKPVSKKVEGIVNLLVFILLITLMILVTINDVGRMFG